MFLLRGGLILFSSSRPARFAAMFTDGTSLEAIDAVSSRNDALCVYLWAFGLPQGVREDQAFLFATEDRAVGGQVVWGRIHVVRNSDGAPLCVRRFRSLKETG